MAGTATRDLPDTASGVLAFARGRRAAADRAEADLLQAAVQWAILHPAESLDAAESFRLRTGGECAVGLAGPGAPQVAEFCVAEFAAAVGLGSEAGKYYLGHALELRYRLPKLWSRVLAGDLAAWKARRIADETISHGLSLEAAGFVDTHVAPVAHRIKPGQLIRLVEEAIGRFMPDLAAQRRRDAADGRHFDIDHHQVSFAGTSIVHGELDLGDALDLDDALRDIAAGLADLGCEESLDVRRSLAAGELARRQLAPPPPLPDRHRGRRSGRSGGEHPLPGHRRPDPSVVRPPRDPPHRQARHRSRRPRLGRRLRGRRPDRRSRGATRHTCVFPWCTRPAPRLKPDDHSCDCDHARPWRKNGGTQQTCTCRLAPLCRRHHLLKTHGRWRYTILDPGTYLWSSPHGYQFLRDHHGTLDVSPDRRTRDPWRD